MSSKSVTAARRCTYSKPSSATAEESAAGGKIESRSWLLVNLRMRKRTPSERIARQIQWRLREKSDGLTLR